MLQEKMKDFHSKFVLLEQVHKAIEIATPAKEAIKKACNGLKIVLDGDEFTAVDEEMKTAIVSVYNIFETASKGLDDMSVLPLFGTEK